jgi:acetyltransferase-like isoleucine patch superfamily enzyme
MKKLLGILIAVLPWALKRRLLQSLWGFKLHPTARIGLALVFPEELVMEAGSSIGHLTVCKGLKRLHLGEHSIIGRGNWITGFPAGGTGFFQHQPDRVPELILGPHSAITNRHLIDCTNSVRIGAFTTFAGFASQILTHSIDLAESRQSSAPVVIGDYCFVGTNSVILGGSKLPDYSVLGAKSLLNKAHEQTHQLYAGVPAKPVKALPPDWKYFQRREGFVH